MIVDNVFLSELFTDLEYDTRPVLASEVRQMEDQLYLPAHANDLVEAVIDQSIENREDTFESLFDVAYQMIRNLPDDSTNSSYDTLKEELDDIKAKFDDITAAGFSADVLDAKLSELKIELEAFVVRVESEDGYRGRLYISRASEKLFEQLEQEENLFEDFDSFRELYDRFRANSFLEYVPNVAFIGLDSVYHQISATEELGKAKEKREEDEKDKEKLKEKEEEQNEILEVSI